MLACRVALWLCLSALALPSFGAAQERPSISPEPFFKHADYGEMKLSPSGKYIGALIPMQGRRRLAVIDLQTRESQIAAAMQDDDIQWFEWVNDARLAFSVVDIQAGSGEQYGEGLFAANRDGTEFRILAPTVRGQARRMQTVYRYVRLQSVLHDGSDDILVVANEHGIYPDVYRMDTKTGRKTLQSYDKPGDVYHWVSDRRGQVRAAVTDEKSLSSRTFWRPDGGAKWVQLAQFRRDESQLIPIAFDGDGSLIVASNSGRDTMAIYRYDTEKKAVGEMLAAHAQSDLTDGVQFDRAKNRVVGIRYDGPMPGAAWFDDDWAQLQRSIDAALPGRRNIVTPNESIVLVYSYSDTDPGAYYLFDVRKRRLEFLAGLRRTIKAQTMPTRRPVRYVARDGLEIPGYLTLPRDKEAKNLPLVLYVHGGPWVRGAYWRWSAEPAFLSSLGYAVLEPEFRGSEGWGAKLFLSGMKQWGRAMQDDLNDGVDWLAKEGTIDPARVCIMGASYGGYAVMIGLARDPDRWRCGINYFGVTDIKLFFDISWSDYAHSEWIRHAAKDMIGDPVRDAAMLKAVSPLENAAKIKAPVLMAYGLQDQRVPVVHGERMRDALARHGTPVEWVAYRDEGHGLMLEANRFDFYGRVAKFLAVHNPPD